MNKSTILSIINRFKASYIIVLMVSIVAIALLFPQTIQSVMHIIRIRPLDNKVIVIDPGHGGIDGGTNLGDILEKDINLSISLKLRDLLSKKGATVIMTREIDNSLDDHIIGNGSRHREDLAERVKIIDESNADIFISLHVNHIKNEKKQGPIVFYDTNKEEQRYLAEHMQEYLNDILTYKKIGITVKHVATAADYYILRNSIISGIIVEMGFISNVTDRKLLLEEDHQNEIVEQITKAVIVYFNDMR